MYIPFIHVKHYYIFIAIIIIIISMQYDVAFCISNFRLYLMHI